jgi:hypothetical protein
MDQEIQRNGCFIQYGKVRFGDFERVNEWIVGLKTGPIARIKKNRPLQADGTKVQYYFESAITE